MRSVHTMMTIVRTMLLALVVLTLTLFTVPALADTAPVPSQASGYTILLNYLINTAGSILAIVLIALSAKALKKMGINLSQDQEAAYQSIIQKAIGYAEEMAHKKADALPKSTSDDKLSTAVKFAISQIEQQGLEKKGEEWVSDHIHAALGLKRN